MTGAGMRALVLVIDDDAVIRLTLKEFIEDAGLTFREAEDGRSGLAAFEVETPDIVLLDVMMPDMDGFAVCSALRATSAGAHVPILMATGRDDLEAVNRAYEAGATDFTTKPLNYPLLVRRVHYMLRAKRTADTLREREASLAHAQRVAKLGSWDADLELDRFSCSEQLGHILGTPEVGRLSLPAVIAAIHPEDRARVEDQIQLTRASGRRCHHEYRLVRPDGTIRIVRQEIEALSDDRGKARRLIGTLQDITERRDVEERIRELAYHDGVTGLPNRTLLNEHLGKALEAAKRHRRHVSVLYLDLDHFKRVNDTWGHKVGDEMLRRVAERINGCLRVSDSVGREIHLPGPDWQLEGGGQTLARLGGDEFVVLLTEVKRVEDAAIVARRILDGMEEPFIVESTEVFMTASIGISAFPTDGDDADTLLQRADAAVYQCKESGRNGYHFYTAGANAQAFQRLNVEANLRRALENDQFLLHYQPKIDVATGGVAGMEALVRWHHPEIGMVSPGEFIPIAEETRLIVPLGEWVLRTACAQTKQWLDAGFGPFRISVNLSAVQFRDGQLLAMVSRCLSETGLDPKYLELELTEGLLMDDTDVSIKLMHELRALGLELSIDDFGTGYSSLSYLKRFPINVLKIDRCFIREITSDEVDAAIVRGTVGLAHNLRLRVVAEGVEEESQLEALRECGVDEIQGFHFSRPLPADEFAAWVSERTVGARRAVG